MEGVCEARPQIYKITFIFMTCKRKAHTIVGCPSQITSQASATTVQPTYMHGNKIHKVAWFGLWFCKTLTFTAMNFKSFWLSAGGRRTCRTGSGAPDWARLLMPDSIEQYLYMMQWYWPIKYDAWCTILSHIDTALSYICTALLTFNAQHWASL